MTSLAFSTPETQCLEREPDLDEEIVNIKELWVEENRILCKDWINENQFKKVCLQFPDNYLKHSTNIYGDLKQLCTETEFYVLADTSYGSCCVDEIAAAHVDSDAIIHFGNACKSKVSGLPVLYVFSYLPFDCDKFKYLIEEQQIIPSLKDDDNDDEKLSIFLDTGYQYLLKDKYKEICDLQKIFLPNLNKITIEKYPADIDEKTRKEKDCTNSDNDNKNRDICIFIGKDGQSFFNLSMSIKSSKWFIYDPFINELKTVNPLTTNFIRRRYYYIEKCKDAQKLGLIVATLTSDGYLEVIDHIKKMAKCRGIRTYLISVGRINPEKLANFMEIDCFVLIGCPFNNLYTSKEFFKPVVSVFEAEMALNPAWQDKLPEMYATDFKDILPNGRLYREFESKNIRENDISLITGKIRNVDMQSTTGGICSAVTAANNGVLVDKNNQHVMQISSGISLEDRSWKGLDPALDKREPAKLEKGLTGIPIKYTNL